MLRDQLQRPLRDLRISVTDRCNFRCTYCMPESEGPYHFMPRKKYLSFEQIERVVRIGAEMGVRKIRLTGGEPLLRPRLPDLVKRICSIEAIEDLALTTNASALESQAQDLWDAGLRRLTVSLDGLDESIVQKISGSSVPVSKVVAGIMKAKALGFRIKMNVVVIRGVNESQILPLMDFAVEHGINLRFIEYMDVGGAEGWQREQAINSSEIAEALSAHYDLSSLKPRYQGEVATRWSLEKGGKNVGEVGFVSSVSKPFCRDCNRLRLSADGQLFKCLFATQGVDTKPFVDDEEQTRELMHRVWSNRDDRYSELRQELGQQGAQKQEGAKVPMSFIGG